MDFYCELFNGIWAVIKIIANRSNTTYKTCIARVHVENAKEKPIRETNRLKRLSLNLIKYPLQS